MIEKFFNWLRIRFLQPQQVLVSSPFDDVEFQSIIRAKQTQLEKAEKIVGKNPMEQIDYTIEHGLEKFNKVYYDQSPEPPKQVDFGKRTPRPVVQVNRVNHQLTIHHTATTPSVRLSGFRVISNESESYVTEIRGGIGNKALFTYYHGTSEEKEQANS